MNRETRKLLWKLGFLTGEEIPEDGLDPRNLPEDVFKKEKIQRTVYYRVDDHGVTPEEVELFLKVKKVSTKETLRRYALVALVCAVCLTVLLAGWLLPDWVILGV